MEETVSPIKWILIGVFVAGCAALVLVPALYFLMPSAQQQEELKNVEVVSKNEAAVRALETYQAEQAQEAPAPMPAQSEIDAAIQAATPQDGPTQAEQQAALEAYLNAQKSQ